MVSYGISINLVEVTWKSKIKMQFPNPNDYSAFMGDFSSSTGAVTFVMMLLSRVIFRKFGWGVAALITPSVILITGDRPNCHVHPLLIFYRNISLSKWLTWRDATHSAKDREGLHQKALKTASRQVVCESFKISINFNTTGPKQ